MVSLSTWVRYAANKFEFSISLNRKRYYAGQINAKEFSEAVWKYLFLGKLTMTDWTKGEEMTPTIAAKGTVLLFRKMVLPVPTQVFVGDMVLLIDPEKTNNRLVRRLAAIEGYEMVSKDEKEEPFILEEGQCWVLSENESLKAKEAKDSRSFGPVRMSNILGRVIYAHRSAAGHGPVQNSRLAMAHDSSVLAVELDVDELANSSKI